MKPTIHIISIATILVLSIAVGCKKQKSDQLNQPSTTTDIEYKNITDCHLNENPYPSQITSAIEGTWVWEKKGCFWSGPQTITADKHVVVTFNDGGLYKVTEDGKLISEGSWNLTNGGDEFWSVKCSEPNTYLHGRVILCKDELVFFSSHIDGCDHYFTRR